MHWRLGIVGNLLWDSFPELRSCLEELEVSQTQVCRDIGLEPNEMSPYELYSEFRVEILEPAIENLPASEDMFARCCEFLEKALELDPDINGIYREALLIRVGDKLSKENLGFLISKNPKLSQLVA